MTHELIVCIPGPWPDRTDFLRRIIMLEPAGDYMFAGGILAHPGAKDHVPLDFYPPDIHMANAFRIAGQGKISEGTIEQIARHTGIAYLHFPIDIRSQRERILKFTQVLQRAGGFGVKLESCGIAHQWDRWFTLLSGKPFDIYSSAVVLIGDDKHYYSCGMHHFGLAECAAPRTLAPVDAAYLMNHFNMWRIVEQPHFESGHTFSLDVNSPRFRMFHENDSRHSSEELFFNTHGFWRLALDSK